MNHLKNETSPYLQQHVNNPVDWYPWCKEALEKARRENKPILLSIGYSACHWCHVMAHESFEDEETARMMNDLFVNIKVDREERPDLDKIYQLAHQVLTGRGGGWPLNIFLTPDQLPFYSGTYFPLTSRYNLPAFKDVLRYMADVYHRQSADIAKQNEGLLDALERLKPEKSSERLNAEPVKQAQENLSKEFDRIYGGFGQAPKFPNAPLLQFLLFSSTEKWNEIGQKSLDKMALSGLYDQIGGGFFRYTVDRKWEIPHFEKMLYDNAQLIGLYAQAYDLTPNDLYQRVVEGSIRWLVEEMRAPEGAFYTAIDADSEGVEGKFYLWTLDECKALLSTDEFEAIKLHFNLTQSPNFEDQWHLYVERQDDKDDLLKQAKQKLLKARNQRLRPGRDEKLLTSWNALTIKSLAIAARVFHRPDWLSLARGALDFIRNRLWKNGRLLASYKDGNVNTIAYLDDYAFLLDALLTLLTIDFRVEDLTWASELADVVLAHFYDRDQGGFYYIADDHERIFYRPKSFYDEAIPAGNGIMLQNLLRLGYLLGNTVYLDAVEAGLRVTWPLLKAHPESYAGVLMALAEWCHPAPMIVLRGEPQALPAWQKALSELKNPRIYVLAIPATIEGLPAALAEKTPRGERVAYVCQGEQCLPPVFELNDLVKMIMNKSLFKIR